MGSLPPILAFSSLGVKTTPAPPPGPFSQVLINGHAAKLWVLREWGRWAYNATLYLELNPDRGPHEVEVPSAPIVASTRLLAVGEFVAEGK